MNKDVLLRYYMTRDRYATDPLITLISHIHQHLNDHIHIYAYVHISIYVYIQILVSIYSRIDMNIKIVTNTLYCGFHSSKSYGHFERELMGGGILEGKSIDDN